MMDGWIVHCPLAVCSYVSLRINILILSVTLTHRHVQVTKFCSFSLSECSVGTDSLDMSV